MVENTRLHDGIAGALALPGSALGYDSNALWLLLPVCIGAPMLQSAFGGFCPVYYTPGKLHSK